MFACDIYEFFLRTELSQTQCTCGRERWAFKRICQIYFSYFRDEQNDCQIPAGKLNEVPNNISLRKKAKEVI